jgi:hypothetical protein
MPDTIRDHSNHAHDQIGDYLQTKTRALGLGAVAPVPSVAELLAARDGGLPPAVHASTVSAVAGQPAGFGVTVNWVGDEDLAVTGFVATTDEWGLAVSGVTDFDTFEVVDAAGTATFAQQETNKGVASLVTIIAAGASLGAAVFGAPELAPFITAAGAALAKAFPESKHPWKPRDAYGQIPGTDEFAMEEGGMIVCAPDAQGTYQSGDDDHRDRWAQSEHDRSDDHLPAQVQAGFFVQRDHNRRTLYGNGTMIIAPWDYKFLDNIGVYRVDFILRRGQPPIVQ